jgi:hypothetical protein
MRPRSCMHGVGLVVSWLKLLCTKFVTLFVTFPAFVLGMFARARAGAPVHALSAELDDDAGVFFPSVFPRLGG